MSASTTGQQKNKRREREFAIPERKTRRKARRFSWDLLEIFLMQLYLGSRSLSSSPGGLKHLQPLSLVWNKGKADTYSFIYSCASWDGIHLEMPYSIDHPLLPKTTTSHFTLFLCVRGFLIPPTPPYLPPPFGYWSACECKCFLLEICFKMRKRFLEITWKKKWEGSHTQCITDAQTSLLIFMIHLDWSLVPSSSRSPGSVRKVRAYLSSSEGMVSPLPKIPKQTCLRLRRFNPRIGSGSRSQILSSLAMKSDFYEILFQRWTTESYSVIQHSAYSPPASGSDRNSSTAIKLQNDKWPVCSW